MTPRKRATEEVLFTMRVNENLVFWSCKTSHSSSRSRNDLDKISAGTGLELSLGEEIRVHKSHENVQYSSSNHRDHESHGYSS